MTVTDARCRRAVRREARAWRRYQQVLNRLAYRASKYYMMADKFHINDRLCGRSFHKWDAAVMQLVRHEMRCRRAND